MIALVVREAFSCYSSQGTTLYNIQKTDPELTVSSGLKFDINFTISGFVHQWLNNCGITLDLEIRFN
jgi:hypothetical protein